MYAQQSSFYPKKMVTKLDETYRLKQISSTFVRNSNAFNFIQIGRSIYKSMVKL